MIGALADAVTAALGGRTETLEHRGAVNEDCLHHELAGLSLALVLLLPVGDCRTEKLLHLAGGLLIREFEDAQSLEDFLAADHIHHETHLAGR